MSILTKLRGHWQRRIQHEVGCGHFTHTLSTNGFPLTLQAIVYREKQGGRSFNEIHKGEAPAG